MSSDIAIVGFSFKGPQEAENGAGLWSVLEERRNLMTEWPKTRVNLDSFYDERRENFNKLHSRGAHFIKDDPSLFDAPFFSITAKEAASMDPQHRLTLEASYRAFENAGIPVEILKGSRTAVFAASMSDDYNRMYVKDPESVARGNITGNSLSLLANRVSWQFDLLGPSVHIDTACSGSLVALDMACQSLQSGDASMALVLGANLILGPEGSIMLHNGKYLSTDGVSYSFDYRANGYARGEGVIGVVIKPLLDAIRDGDMVRAVIRATASNQDGRTPIMTQPSVDAQEQLIRHTYKKAGLGLELTRFVEAHGTGTPVGDPIEVKAIGRVFRPYRSSEEPIYVGSLKSNIGHLEGSAGLAGVVKAILVLEKGIIPPNALFEQMNPDIDSGFYHVRVPTQSVPWPQEGLRRVSVNSFGFGGSNSHCILDDAYHYLQDHGLMGNHCTVPSASLPHGRQPSATSAYGQERKDIHGLWEIKQVNGVGHATNGSADGTNGNVTAVNGKAFNGKANPITATASEEHKNTRRLLVWTAADDRTLRSLLQAYVTHLKTVTSDKPLNLERLAFTLAARRSIMLWRSFAVVEGNTVRPCNSGAPELLASIPTRALMDPNLVFVFTGQGAQYVNMGLSLIRYPIFNDTLQQVDSIFRSLGSGWSVFDELACAKNIHRPEYSQPLCTGLQIALVELLKSFGVVPAAVMGHSSGEIAAAYTTGALSLASACKVAYWRGHVAGKLCANTKTPGAMLSANLPADKVYQYLSSMRGKSSELVKSVQIACINSPLNSTLSGPEQAIDVVLQQLNNDNIFGQKLRTGVAYHTSAMSTVAGEYADLMGSLEPGQYDFFSAIPMVSSVSGQVVNSPEVLSDMEYWVENLVSPVKFSEALVNLTQGDFPGMTGAISHFVEIGPHPALRRYMQEALGASNQIERGRKHYRYGSVLHKSKPASQAILEFFGQLFCDGYPVPVAMVNEQQPNVKDQHSPPFNTDCPEYPFDHSRTYWLEPRMSRDYRLRLEAPMDSLGARHHDWNPLEPKWRRFLSSESTPWTKDHVVLGNAIYPGTGMLIMAMEAVKQISPENRTLSGYFIKEAHFLHPLTVGDTDEDSTETIIQLRRIQSPYEKESVWSEIKITTQLHDRWTECFRATVQMRFEDENATQVDGGLEKRLWDDRIRKDLTQATECCTESLGSHDFYKSCQKVGLSYGKSFQLLHDITWDGDALAVAKVHIDSAEHQTVSLTHPAVLDCALQVLLAQRTKGLSNPPPAMVPSRLRNAWVAASGWQPSNTSSVQVLTKCTSGPNDPGMAASVHLVSDDETPICAIEQIVMAPVSGIVEEQSSEQMMLYNVRWKPQISFMGPLELGRVCDADLCDKDETAMAVFRKTLDLTLDVAIRKVLRTLSDSEHRRIPGALRKHVEWMQQYVTSYPASVPNDGIDDLRLEEMLNRVEAMHPPWNIFTAVARDLKPILLGDQDPLQLAFETGLAETFYADVFKNICDSRFQTLLELLAHENPTMRILEVGAGTGGMTRHILSALSTLEEQNGGAQFSEYTYTDISPSFFDRAGNQFEEHKDRMDFKVFNIDHSACGQGFTEASYDVIVAGCVLHATKNIRKTIQNLRALLKPGGRLLMLEVVAPENITTNFAFGLLPGWWSSTDDYRRQFPTITEQQWDGLLREEGFSGNDLVLQDYRGQSYHTFSIIVSTLSETTQSDAWPSIKGRVILLLHDTSDQQAMGFGESLREHLPRRDTELMFLSQDNEREIRDDDILISLLETSKPFLSTVSKEQYKVIQDVVLKAQKLLWVTSTSLDDVRYPEYAVMQGFLRSIRSENADKHIVSVACESYSQSDRETVSTNPEQVAKVFKKVFASGSDEVEFCIRDGKLLTARLVEEAALNQRHRFLVSPHLKNEQWEEGFPVKLAVGTSGFLDTLEFVDDELSEKDLGPFEIEIEPRAWGLNFRDVFVALGRLPADDMGVDCAGVVRRIGSKCDEITHLRPGSRVCGMVAGCMRTFPRASASCFVQIPDSLSFDEAASFLSPAGTAYYSLVEVARLRKDEKVLIHSASGATGQMAIWIAKMVGAEVFATVGLHEKKRILVDKFRIPEDHIFFSRNTTFYRGIMRVTKGYGVDVVLNSLSGDSLRASWECIAPHGRFIEIGKADITANSSLPMASFARNVTFAAVDMHYMMHAKPESATELLGEVMGLIESGAVQSPYPLHKYSTATVEEAFRFMQSGRNTGRIIITVDGSDLVRKRVIDRRAWRFDPNASYVIAGASGGLGRAISKWMAAKGAKHLILLSRSGATSPAAATNLAELRKQGVNVEAPKCDVSDQTSLSAALEDCARTMPSVKGCINSAMALNDTWFNDMTHYQWEETIRSKVQSSWNLHSLLPQQGLDFFVLLSSLAGIFGSIGQSNYAGGCAYQDALARYRVAHGQKAISFDLGWMRNIGIIAETVEYRHNRQIANDMMPIEDTELMALLDLYCDPDRSLEADDHQSQLLVGAVTPADCLARGLEPPALARRPMFAGFSTVMREGRQQVDGIDGSGIDFAALFRKAETFEDRAGVVVSGLSTKLARAMSITADDVQPSKQLSDYGVDSLMAVELRNWILKEFRANVAVFEILGSSTLTAIGALVVEKSEVGEEK